MKYGSITTGIIADGLVFNMDAANRASTIPSSTTTKTFNTVDTSISGSIVTDATWANGTPPTFNFDGSDGYINLNSLINSISTQQKGSISIWFKHTNTARKCFMSLGSTTVNQSYFYTEIQANNTLWVQSKNNWYFNPTPTYNVDTWHHFSIIQDGVSPKLYVNGVLQTISIIGADTTAWFNNTTIENINVGRFYAKDGSIVATLYFDGDLGPIHIYNRALSANEVLQNYNALKGRFGL